MTTKPSHRLTLRDRLSRLNFTQSCKLLGAEGRQLIQQGGKREIDIDEQVYLQGDLFRVKFDDHGDGWRAGPTSLELHGVPVAM